MKRIAATAAFVLTAAASAAPRPQVDTTCIAHGMGPLLECTVRVTQAGRALDGVSVKLGASMPSMPMAHSVKPVAAVPTGEPGTYRGTLELEMNGAWAVQVDLSGAVRDRVVRRFAVDECDGDKRCPVNPIAAGANASRP